MGLESLLDRRDIPSEAREVIKKELSEVKGIKARFEYLLRSGPAIIYACEPWGDYQTKFMSENVKDVLGYDPQEFLYNNTFWVDGIHPEDKQRVTESFSKISDALFFSETYRFRQKDGNYRWMLEEANLIQDEEGKPIEIVGYWTDISSQKSAEEPLRQERENLYGLLNSINDVIYIINSQYEIKFINAATEKEFGPVDGKKCYQYFNDFLEACPWCTMEDVVKGETIRREKTIFANKKTYDMIDTPFKNLDGEVSSLAILRDITERKQIEEALRKSEEKYRSFVENFQGIAFKGYEDFSTGFFLGKIEEITGYTGQDFTSGNIAFNQLIHPEDVHQVNTDVEEFMSSSQKAAQREYRIIDKNGNLHWIQESIQKFHNEKLKKQGVYGTLFDISERKKAEEEIKIFKTISDNAGYGVVISDIHGSLIYVNDSFARMHGYLAHELVGKNFSIFHTKEQMNNVNRLANQLRQKGSYIAEEVWHKRKDNKIFPTLMNGTLITNEKGKPQFQAVTAIDITSQKLAEDELKKSKGLLEKTFDSLDSAIFVLDSSNPPRIIDCNPSASQIFGYEKQEMLNKSTTFLHINSENLLIFQKMLYPYIEEKGSLSAFEFTMKRKSGESFPTEHYVSQLFDENNTRVGWISVVRDITQRKEGEKELRESELQFRTFMETLPEPVWIYQNYRCRYANPAAEATTGYSMDELNSMQFWDFLHPDYKDMAIEGGKALENGLSPPSESIVKIITKSGNEIWLDARLELTDFEGKRATLITAMDITKRKEAEEAMRRSEEWLRAFMDAATDSIAIWDSNLNLIDCNKAMIEFLPEGTTKEDIIGRNLADFDPRMNERKIYSQFSDVIKTGISLTLEGRPPYPIEDKRNLFVTAFKVGDGLGIITTDITELKRAEDALRESEIKYRTLVERANDGIAIVEGGKLGDKFKFVNQRFAQMLGYKPEELLNMSYTEVVHPDVFREINDRRKARLMGKEVSLTYDSKLIRKDNSPLEVGLNLGMIDYQGEDAVLAIVRDITERKKAEEQLQYQANLLTYVSDAVIASDLDFRITSWNKAAEHIYGWKEEETLGKRVGDFLQSRYPLDRQEDVIKDFMKEGVWQAKLPREEKMEQLLTF